MSKSKLQLAHPCVGTTNLAVPPENIRLEDCSFYTVQKIPGLANPTAGEWDIRNTDAYLGYVDFKNKSVLELGPASGYLTFWMENKGAVVTSVELSTSNDKWDVVPDCKKNWRGDEIKHMKNNLKKVQNAYWYAHRASKSEARVVNFHVSNLPSDIGEYDISTMCCVLLHIQNPFLAIQNMLRHTKEKAIITDKPPIAVIARPSFRNLARRLLGDINPTLPFMQFLPTTGGAHDFAWWLISPEAIVNMAGLFGFGKCTITHSTQYQNGGVVRLYTVVCERTTPIENCWYS